MNTRIRLISLGMIVLWFALAGIGGPIFGKLADVTSNDQTSFLPSSAESTQVQKLQEQFNDSKAIPALVVVGTAVWVCLFGSVGRRLQYLPDVARPGRNLPLWIYSCDSKSWWPSRKMHAALSNNYNIKKKPDTPVTPG